MLTARDAIDERILGLDSGAEDYLVKPFGLRELKARIRSQVRRGEHLEETMLTHGSLTLDPAQHRVTRAGDVVPVGAREFAGIVLAMALASGCTLYHAKPLTADSVTRAQMPPDRTELFAAARLRRLDLKALEQGYQSPEATIHREMLGQYPRLTIGSFAQSIRVRG